MRIFRPILTALSLLLLVLVTFFWVRSYLRYEGILHFGDSAPLVATAVGEGETLDGNVRGRSTGFISYKGRVTYVSIANPLLGQEWEAWSEPVNAPPSTGAKRLVVEAARHGLGGGASKTQTALEGQGVSLPLRLPYRYFTIPYWLLAMVLIILPYRWVDRRRLVARRSREGRCLRCGRELVGGSCPKCGAATA
jgi:hypothetical protein